MLDNWALLTIVGETGREQLQLLELYHHQQQQKKGGGASQKELGAALTASADIGPTIQLLYNSADFKGLATGRNVSEAMSMLADSVCLHSVSRPTADGAAGEQSQHLLYLLGRNGVFTVQLMDQAEQLDVLMAKNDFTSALLYAVDVCNGRVRDRSRFGDFRAKASHAVPHLVARLLDHTIDGLDSGRIDELVVHYKRNIHVLIRACISTSHFELLYGTVYGQLQKDSLCRPIFLELLEEFVLDSQLDRPPPGLVNDYLAYLLSEGQLPQFEQSVTRLPVDCMDLHQVMTTCLQHQLFDGLCHVMNNAMRDYIGPLKEMCEHMQHTVRKEVLSDCDIAQGNKLLLYLSCCLAGRAYPYGELPDEHLAKTVPLETYKFLVQLRPKFVTGPPSSSATTTPSPTTVSREDEHGGHGIALDAATDQHGQPAAAVQPSNNNNHTDNNNKPSVADLRFPHLQLLLKLDPQQFLNVINTCADAPVFASVDGRLKRLVDVLIAMCVEKNGEDERNELGPLLIAFVVGLLQKGAIPKDVFIFSQLIKRVLQRQFLNVRAQKQAEQHIVDLLRVVPEIDLDNVLEIAQRRPYVHICAYIFTIRKQYVQLLECCLGDLFEPKNVFHILADLLTNLRDHGQLSELRQFVCAQLGKLSNLDPQLAAHLVLSHLPELLADARSNPRKLPFQFVRQCFALRRQQGHRTLCGADDDHEQDEQFFDYLFEGIIDEADAAAMSSNGAENCEATIIASLDNELADLLRYWLPLGAATDHCLNVAMQWQQQKQRPNAILLSTISLLLVARGHIQRAFEHIFSEGIERQLDSTISQPSVDDRCVASLLELAAVHPSDARRGDWLAKLFRHLLKTLPEEMATKSGDNAAEFTASVVQEQMTRPNSQLFRVLCAIIEQQHHYDEEAEQDGLRDSQIGAEKCTSASVLVAELFSHPRFQHAPLHLFHRFLRQILLWCEIRVLMERATRDCARHELAVQFAHNTMLGLGKRPAFAIQQFSSVDNNSFPDESAKGAVVGTSAALSPTKSSSVDMDVGMPIGHCLWCRRRIDKSFHLFPCGHTLHLECVEEQHKLIQQQQQQNIPGMPTTTAMTTTMALPAAKGRQRPRRFCPCDARQQNCAAAGMVNSLRRKWWHNNSRDGDDPTGNGRAASDDDATLATSSSSGKQMPLSKANETKNPSAGKNDREMDERRAASAVFRRLEHDFPIRTGPPPPAKTANNAFHRTSSLI
ncbi:hypothetical protein niasHT_030871 [Heterodera trifolii]|uniref:Vacuolar protein sorting-associated protein 8 central domain-containing protein n=1 Tax=Heterodera trifolii TaxID=157864 RepID=A0ABD2HV24_9BILA